jgi:hypothetical protein
MGDADTEARPGAEPGQEERPSLFLAKGCIALIVLAVFVTVVLPIIVWVVSILVAGSR